MNPSRHVLAEEVRLRQEEMNLLNAQRSLAPPSGVNTEIMTEVPLDAINPAIGPFDILAGPGTKVLKNIPSIVSSGSKILGRGVTIAIAKTRDVKWIRNTPNSQFQSKFKHADVFGIKANPSKQGIESYKKSLIEHVRSSNTKVIKGTYHKEPATHYYNKKTGVNIIRDENGYFKSVWKLTKEQKVHIEKRPSWWRKKMKYFLGYDILIEKFLNKNISAKEFESQYIQKFLNSHDDVEEDLFLILDWLFAEVDSFSNSPEAFPNDWIDEEQLRNSAKKALDEIRSIEER